MRVLHILNSLDMGGIEIYVMNLYKHIDRKKIQFDFLIFSKENCFEEDALKYGAKIYKCEETNYFKQMNYVYHILKTHKYKIVHIHNCALKGLIRGILPTKVANREIYVISHSHNTGYEAKNVFDKLLRFFMKLFITYFSDALFACSNIAAESKYLKLKNKEYYILKNGIEVNKYEYDENIRNRIRNNLKIKPSTILIGNVGRLENQKNQIFLINIFKRLIESGYKNIQLIIIGNGSLKQELKKEVINNKLQNNIIFLGERNNVNEYLMAMDIFAFPSIYEGLGISLIEAQASGLPCVVSEFIPTEAIVTNLVKRIELDVDKWENSFLSINMNKNREDFAKFVKSSGYDINSVSKELENFYLKIKQSN